MKLLSYTRTTMIVSQVTQSSLQGSIVAQQRVHSTDTNTFDSHIVAMKLHKTIVEILKFARTLRSDLWKESKHSQNFVREDKEHNYKTQHFDFWCCPQLLDVNVHTLYIYCIYILTI